MTAGRSMFHLLGRKIEAIVVDGRSDWPTFASTNRKKMENFMTKRKRRGHRSWTFAKKEKPDVMVLVSLEKREHDGLQR
jgi:hypothetical protein